MPRHSFTRLALIACSALILSVSSASPAWAFGSAGATITGSVCQAVGVAQKVLGAAAVLAFMIGLAPMLWGEVKTRWLISCLVFATLVGTVTKIVGAFAGTGAC